MILLADDGSELYNGSELLNFNYQTTPPVLDVYATNSLDLGELGTGTHHFKAVLHDKLKNTDAEFTFDFEIIQ